MKAIFFPRYQRRFLKMGDVGGHPQFRHLQKPPAGFRFEALRMGWLQWLVAFPQSIYLAVRGWRELFTIGAAHAVPWYKTFGFLWSRGLGLVPAPANRAITFLPTFPFTHQNEKWFLEIEDVTTLFRPFVLNGQTEDIKLKDLPQFHLVKGMLESKNCLGVLTHVSSTQSSIKKIFESEKINAKTEFLATPYLPNVPIVEADLNTTRSREQVQFFFNNSWHQDPTNFYLRGGISILEAFEVALAKDMPVRLVIRSRLPKDLSKRFAQLLSDPRVEVLDRFLPADEYLNILRASHFFLLPSARLHVVSLLESMYYGAVPIVSDGWGMNDYIDPGVTGFVVSGAQGAVSWVDEHSGELRENYEPMFRRPGLLTGGLLTVMEQILATDCHSEMSTQGHRRVRDAHSVENFNPAFSRFLEKGLETL
jgi:glycosyltransferase involved in cell wall biosynthesis